MRFEIHGSVTLPDETCYEAEAEVFQTDRCSVRVIARSKDADIKAGMVVTLFGKDMITGGTFQTSGFRAAAVSHYQGDSRLRVAEGVLTQARIVVPHSDKPCQVRFFIGPIPDEWVDIFESRMTLGGRTYCIAPFRQGIISHRLTVDDVPYSRIQECESVIIAACYLFKAAVERDITLPMIEVVQDGAVVEWFLNNVDDALPKDRGPIPEEEIVRFVENGLSYVQDTNSIFPLTALMDIMQLFQGAGHLEVQGLLLANFLEIVRFNYASNRPAYQRKNDRFFLPSGAPATFESILEDLFREYRIGGWRKDFATLRNEVIHQGSISNNSTGNAVDRIIELKYFCDTVLLALLDWDKAAGSRRFYAEAESHRLVPFVR